MTETRFPADGLSAEYGDIIISDLTSEVTLSVTHSGNLILTEKYSPDINGQITIKDIGKLAMMYYESVEFLNATGEYASPVILNITIESGTTISKNVTIYPSVVNFSGTLNVSSIKQIPLSRSTTKQTSYARKEFISFYGGDVSVKVYAVYKGDDKMIAVTNLLLDLITQSIFVVDVSPAVIANLIGQQVTKLVYYNVYTNDDAVIRFNVLSRNWQFEKTFVFRNCFGAQESFTCTGDEIEERKWTREFGNINAEKIDFSRELENSIKINTGYISTQDVEVVEDLLNSDIVCLIDSSGFNKVTILEEDFSNSSRKDELKSVSFTYRLSSHKILSKYYKFKKPGIFTPDFDSSFE